MRKILLIVLAVIGMGFVLPSFAVLGNTPSSQYPGAVSPQTIQAGVLQREAEEAAAKNDMTSPTFVIPTNQFNLIGNKDSVTATSAKGGINNVNTLAVQIVRMMMIALSLLCTVLMVAGGIVMATAGGNEDRVSKGKTMLTYSLIGLFVALSSFALISTVGWVLSPA